MFGKLRVGHAVAALLFLIGCFAPRGAYAQSQQPEVQRDDLVGRLRVVPLYKEKLEDVARANDVSVPNTAAANWGISEFFADTRERVLLPRAHLLPEGLRNGILVNRAEFRLYYIKGGVVLFTAPIGLGEDGLDTPAGTSRVVRKKEHPSWIPTPEALEAHPEWPRYWPPGPDNPMGQYAMYLGWQYIAIHGNSDVYGIGRLSTRGCIRLYPEDIKSLFAMVPVGTKVEVVDQPVKLGWHDGELFLEAQADEAQRAELAVKGSFTLKPGPNLKDWISGQAGGRAHDVNWQVVADTLARRSGIPSQITGLISHRVNIFEPEMLLSEGLSNFLKAQRGFDAKGPAKPPENRPAYEDIIKAHRLKFPYNI